VCSVGPQENWFDCNVQWTLGDEKKVKFWKDKWIDGQTLRYRFLRLFSISMCKDSVVDEVEEWV